MSQAASNPQSRRLAIIVSHPIQYYVPLYQRLARRDDIAVKVFFTWHAGASSVFDRGFKRPVAWDISLTDGYEYELVPNTSRDPGTHHFFGLSNPSLAGRVAQWRPGAVHITGWAWRSHLEALFKFHRQAIPTLFRGDSHLLDDPGAGPRAWVKRAILRRIYSWPDVLLYVGSANRAYFEHFGVQEDRLYYCPHSIDVDRFAEPCDELEGKAARRRHELQIDDGQCVVLFAGKFERKKQPIEFMHAIQSLGAGNVVAVMVGGGELESEIRSIADADPARFRVLPFQNQSAMPVVYRLGDLFVLPSAYGETWGLAVNEALACGRPVLVSNRVGCAADLVDPGCGGIFEVDRPLALQEKLMELAKDTSRLFAMRAAARAKGQSFDIAATETALLRALDRVWEQ